MRHTSLLHPIHHRHHGLPLLAMAVLFALAVLLWFEPWRGDGYAPVFHGTLFASLATSGDLDLMNEYLMSSSPLWVAEKAARSITAEGYVTDAFPIGPTLLWAPFWLAAHVAARWIAPEASLDPVAPVYTFAFSLAGLFYGFLGFLLLWRVAYRFFPSWLAFAAAVAAFFGSPAAEACFKGYGLSCVYSFFTVALFLYATTECARWPCLRRVVYLALAAGLMVITCWPSIVFLIIPVAMLLRPQSVGSPHRRPTPAQTRAGDTNPVDNAPVSAADFPAPDQSCPPDLVPPPPEPDIPEGRPEAILEAREPNQMPPKGGNPNKSRPLLILVRWVLFLLVFFLVLSPQLLVWHKVFGRWLLVPHFVSFPFSLHDWTPWKRAMLGPDVGLLRFYPVIVFSLIGLLVMALRRNAAGVAMCLAVVLFTAVDNLAWEWGESTGPRRYALLAPFVAIGLARVCDEVRSKGSRFLVTVTMMGLACWGIMIAAADRYGILYVPADAYLLSDLWPLALSEMARHPLDFFADSLLIRYVTQGTPPLESMVSLLLVVLLIPSVTWLGIRHALVLVRRWSLMKALVLPVLAFVLLFDSLVMQSELSPECRSANLALAEKRWTVPPLSSEYGSPIGLASPAPNPSDPALLHRSKALREVLTLNPGHPATAILLARDDRTLGDTAAACDLYRGLAQRGFRAGELGLLETARTREETLEALDLLARRNQSDLGVALEILEAYRANGLMDRARDYLDRIFPPPALYWPLRAQLTPNPSSQSMPSTPSAPPASPAQPTPSAQSTSSTLSTAAPK